MDELGRAVAAKQLKESIQQYLEAVTTVQAALGDPRHRVPPQLNTPSPSVLDGYRGLYFDQAPMEVRNSWAKWMMGMAKRSLQRNWPEVQVEALRGLAMLESDLPEAADYCLAQIDSKSHPTADIHALCALAQCKSKRAPAATQKTATTLLELREKVRSRGLNIDNNWQPRLAQLTNELVRADPDLASALVGHPSFGAAEHLIFTEGFSKETRELARKKFREALVALPTRNWSTGQIRFIATDKAEASWLPLVRNASQEPSLRATAIELLAKRPMQEDYGIFLKAIDSSDRSAWPSAFGGIKKLPVLDAPAELVALASLLSRLDTEASTPSRAEVVARLQLLSKDQRWSDYPKQSDWSGWKAFFQKHLDAVEFQRIAQQRVPPEVWTQQIEQASELAGEASRGSVLFNQAKCAQCHGGGSALGPDLAGISKRFSKQDLFTAIYEPNRDISDRYRAVRVLTSEDQVVVGLPIYDSADGVTLQCADGSLVRINQEDIQQKRTVAESIMPAGLLDNFSPHQLADLMAYLKSL
jgi:putative heme-binding domain-containing protein